MAAGICLLVIMWVAIVQAFLLDLYLFDLERTDARIVQAAREACDDVQELLDRQAQGREGGTS